MAKTTTHAVSDGKLVLTLAAAVEGGYIVTSPLDPELITEAETVEEAFAQARDAAAALRPTEAGSCSIRAAVDFLRGLE